MYCCKGFVSKIFCPDRINSVKTAPDTTQNKKDGNVNNANNSAGDSVIDLGVDGSVVVAGSVDGGSVNGFVDGDGVSVGADYVVESHVIERTGFDNKEAISNRFTLPFCSTHSTDIILRSDLEEVSATNMEEKHCEDISDILIIDTTLPQEDTSLRSTKSSPSASKTSKKKQKGKKAKSPKSTKSPKSPTGNTEDLDKEILQKLANDVPEATEVEHKRFLIARKGDYESALDQLTSYIEWRKKCHLDDVNSLSLLHDDGRTYISNESSVGAQDRADWNSASDAAFLLHKERRKNNNNDKNNEHNVDDTTYTRFPQLAHMVTERESDTFLKSKSGDRILQLLPAQINVKEADDETYALAIALYLDKKLSRDSMEKIVVSVDIRAGSGWPNPHVKKIVPFIKNVVSLLERNFPERLSKCILYPLPAAATILWKMVRIFLDPNTASKIVIIGGGAGIDDKVSCKKFDKILDKSVHTRMEEIRRESFIGGKTKHMNMV